MEGGGGDVVKERGYVKGGGGDIVEGGGGDVVERGGGDTVEGRGVGRGC